MRKYKITIEETETGKIKTYNSDIIFAVLYGEDKNGNTGTSKISCYEATSPRLAFTTMNLRALADQEYKENITEWHFGELFESIFKRLEEENNT